MKRFVVVGLGNFGSTAAQSLHAQGHEVVVVDTSEEAVDRIAAHVTRAAVGDGRNIQILERIGARGAEAGIVSTGDDIAASILATMALRDIGVEDVYVKVISRDHARVMERLGATDSIFPERETALALASRLTGKTLLNYVRLGPGFSIQEMAVPDSWNLKPLRDLELRKKYGITVVAVHDVLLDRVQSPDPDEVLKESDTLLVAGRDDDLARVAQIE
jgi:trk system potassium uptake protein